MPPETQPVRMTNRLRILLRATTFLAGFCFLFIFPARLSAQPSFFNFSYNGPDSLLVGPTCSSMLQGNVPDPVVTSTVGATITMSMFDPIASGFQYNDLFTSGTTAHIFWFVKDNAGHSHTFEYFIKFVDHTPPVFNLTGILDTLQYSSVAAVPPPLNIPVSDNCTGIVNQTFNQTQGPPLCESGVFTRTWTATDANNNTAVFTQTIIIYKDTLSPDITGYPLNGSAACENLATAYPAWLATQIANFSATDPSGILSLTNNAPAVFPAGCKIPLTVRFKALDNCQFQRNVFVTFSTTDGKGPVVIKPPKDTVAYCSQSDQEQARLQQWISTKAYSQAFDSCSAPLSYMMEIGPDTKDSAQVVAAFLASFAGGCSTKQVGTINYNKVHGFVSVKFYALDACGNKTFMGKADFGAIDTLPPVITGSNITEQCGGGNDQSTLQNWINAHGNATVTEDCSDFTWTNFSFTTSNGQTGNGSFNAGPYPTVQANNCSWYVDVTFMATDDCGNSSTKTLRWTIIDTQPPTFTGLQPYITVYCPNPLPTVPDAVVSDNCDANVNVTYTRVYKGTLCSGSDSVLTTWLATDDCGNTTTATQTIFVSDTTRPVFTLVPANLTFRCDTFVLPPVPVMGVNIAATDICGTVVSITTATQSLQDPDPGVCAHYQYNIIRTFTVSDECGNTRTATQTISVIDNLGPVPGGVLDTTALCSALTPFPAPVPIATDACSGLTAAPVKTGQSTVPGLCTDQYTIQVHWVATDVCNNPTPFDQLVHVIDTVPPTLVNIPPNITVECDAIPDPPAFSSFNALDNCDNTVSVSLQETEIRNPDTTACAHWTNYIIKREWTATDNCGNSRTYTQMIQIEDTKPPQIIAPQSLTLSNDIGDCGATITIPGPLSVTDVCSSQIGHKMVQQTLNMMPSGPGQPAVVPVATMNFSMPAPNFPPFTPVVSNPVLHVTLENTDQSGNFNVNDEKGLTLGTAGVDSNCGDKTINFNTITPTQVNNWLADGVLKFALVPNGIGSAAPNLVCSPLVSKATVNLEYDFAYSSAPITLSYSIDGGAAVNYPTVTQEFLSVGMHTVVYTATDCAGNSSTSSFKITVNDTQAPAMQAPANITAYTGQSDCESTVALPFPTITENCAMSASLSLGSAVMPLHFEVDGSIGLVASDIVLNIGGLIPNAVGSGVLRIRHKGHNAQLGQFFKVYDENNDSVGVSSQGTLAGDCNSFFESFIPVTAAQINAWAQNGNTFFLLKSNRDIQNYIDFIGPCMPLQPNGTDGMSQIQVMLEYSYAVVNYTVKKPGNQIVKIGALSGNQSTVTLPPANYTVMYTTTDQAGLTGMTSFNLTVRDTVRPHAICKTTEVLVDPYSNMQSVSLSSTEVNGGSFDNCTPTPNLQLSVSPGAFNCSQAGPVNVTLTVIDSSGNVSTCVTVIQVKNKQPMPMYPAVCENGTLQLFAKPPSNSSYNYHWTGPSFDSPLKDPVVSNMASTSNNGLYCVTITGFIGGCTSSNCVTVALTILGTTPVLTASATNLCPGQPLTLTTSTYSGQAVRYQWYVDSVQSLPTGHVLMDSTFSPIYQVGALPPGKYVFYVKVFASGCSTIFSTPVTVTVNPTPLADAEPESWVYCEGQTIYLNSTSAPGLSYSWSGPGFTTNQQNPSIPNATVNNSGKYILTTQRNGCLSLPDTVLVTVNAKPPQPQIAGTNKLCAGQTLNLVCTNCTTGDQWVWTSPPPVLHDTITMGSPGHPGNVLQIPNANNTHEGNWTVLVSANNCLSDISQPFNVEVQDYPVITTGSSISICKDSLLKLSATFVSADLLSWQWNGPGNFISFEQNPTVPNGATGTYQVVAKTSNGCADTAYVDVTNVTPPSIATIGNNAPACCDGNTDATLIATFVPAPLPSWTYKWTGPPAFGSSTQQSPVIPDVCTPYNGAYTLVVKDSFGCPSLPASTMINIQQPPATPVLTVNPLQPVCAGANIVFSISNPTPGATYLWNRPGSFPDTITSGPSLIIPSSFPWHSGVYSVKVISNNGLCQSGVSNVVTLTIKPIPPVPTIGSNSPVCEGETISFTASFIDGVDYHWTGPGFDVHQKDPQRPMANTGMSGTYMLEVSKDGCSAPITSVNVQVIGLPSAPQAIQIPAGPVCIDAPVSSFLNVVNPVNGLDYTWVDENGFILQGPSTTTSLDLNLPIVLALGPGQHTFRAYASTLTPDTCKSGLSAPINVQFDTIPAGINAYAGMDHPDCVNHPITLAATPPAGTVTGVWSQAGAQTVTIDNSNLPNASFEGEADSMYLMVWSLSNGACKNFSRDTVKITAQYPEIPNGGNDTSVCDISGIRLHAKQGVTTNGIWTQSQQQSDNLHIVIDQPSNPNTTVSGSILRGQTYVFSWQIGNDGCGYLSDPVYVNTYNIKPDAGADQFICSNNNCASVQASNFNINFETGRWYSPDNNLHFTQTSPRTADVCGLKPGPNMLVWELNGGACGNDSRDTLFINYQVFPTAVDDAFSVNFGDTTKVNILLNDMLPSSFTTVITTPPAHGSIIDTLAPGIYVYRPNSGFSGKDQMIYRICNTQCPDNACSFATVFFDIVEGEDCLIPSIITPNGDGFNDQFKIPEQCTVGEGASELEVTIYNQWGDAVFHAKPYLNDWGGTYNNEELPASTYYYVVKLSADAPVKTGFLVIQR